MKAKAWLFAVVAVLALGPAVAALVEQNWVSALIRLVPTVVFGTMAVKEYRTPAPPKAWTRRQTVLTLVLMLPLTLLFLGLVVWMAVASDDTVMRVAFGGVFLLFVGLLSAGAWVVRKEHLQATGAAAS
ncbi:hypothetical protein [Kribbella sp. NPDC051770]|uniref:hypothetical protein n=1 Tax=Kribbella sp. NPDC051770 TaxID=3155413 RepID=UPI00342137E6